MCENWSHDGPGQGGHPSGGMSQHPIDEGRRRALIRGALGLAGAAIGGTLLGGCASGRSGRSMVGQPIPENPTLGSGGREPLARSDGWRRNARRPLQRGVVDGPTGAIPRSAWTDEAPLLSRANGMTTVSFITVHHDAIGPYNDTSAELAARRLDSIRRGHVGGGWADIGYHYAIDPAGRVWSARPEHLQGAHVKDRNPGNLGVMMMGNFERQQPSRAAAGALEDLLYDRMRAHGVRVTQVKTHREWSPTACPGRNLQAFMDETRVTGRLIGVG